MPSCHDVPRSCHCMPGGRCPPSQPRLLTAPPTNMPTRAVLPLAMTGTYVQNSSSAAGMASIMRYSLSNIEPHSVKLWCAPMLDQAACSERGPSALGLSTAARLCKRAALPGGPPPAAPPPLPLPCRAPFALSYAVLAWAGYVLYMHYKSVSLFFCVLMAAGRRPHPALTNLPSAPLRACSTPCCGLSTCASACRESQVRSCELSLSLSQPKMGHKCCNC